MTFSLNQNQREAATSDDRPLLIVAGAGTGKTRTLTARIIHLIQRGVPPDKICALTFTNKAAREMLQRIMEHGSWNMEPGKSSYSPFIGTFHSLGARILRKEGYLVGRKPNFVIFDEDDSMRIVKKIIKGLMVKEEFAKKNLKPGVFRNIISEIKNGMKDSGSIQNSSALGDQTAALVFERYERELLYNNAFDFDDLIEKPVKIFRLRPMVLFGYHKKFSHILVDEYQDINNAQYEFVKLLAGKEGNLSVVGDHEQTIYGWRGSDIEIFLNFERDWPNAKIVLLEENYRSTANIIAAAGGVIKNNKYYSVEWGTRNLWTKNESGELVEILENADEYEEAEKLVERIMEHRAWNTSEFAILYRTNAQSRAIEQALLENGVPYKIYGGVKFYERREIRDLVAALRMVLNSEDQISRERLLKNLGKRRLSAFEEAISNFQEKAGQNPIKLVEVFMKSTDYADYLERNFINPTERQENVAELVTFASEFGDLAEFLEKVSLLEATDNIEHRAWSMERRTWNIEHKKGVSLMTIHLAKGLEFDNVMVAGLSEGLLPHHRSMESGPEIEEERRLMYVAMTRAKKKLFLSFYNLPSRFLSEVPAEFTNFAGQRALDDEERYITLD